MLLGLLTGLAGAEVADDVPVERFTHGALEILDPWAKGTLGDAHAARVFFQFRNHGERADFLIGARCTIATAGTLLRAGARTVSRIALPPGGALHELHDAGYHLELRALALPLTLGKTFPLELTFERAGTIVITVTSRFHSPGFGRRLREAARRGDIETLRALDPGAARSSAASE
ncbi:MAG: copper chaperone PCu(A)C [Bradyrhizobium sp.]|uniref:copper chaperone PCu(A)C n=1 Tax=Bradyrhizobium sp. TaxID=376 RepID=UPI003D13D877